MLDIDRTKLEALLKYSEPLYGEEKSYSLHELAKIWNTDIDTAKTILRKLRREGFIRRTRSGRYKLSFAGKVLIAIYKRVKR
ncbi:hypothetical protein Igag_1221 [Ignisphaera aggregans DSM 17230]|uniref:Uncharacterized protein n=1 Tax=Ignisphaera aggregans (strain DSM 17230 / JCM 13409 / AQ1.S1) TaxID=583356 RepID=E0SPA0_IGNAA|nr:hypothetical protein Igag_1221 [Ignisphaera aggregans DSM 17230]